MKQLPLNIEENNFETFLSFHKNFRICFYFRRRRCGNSRFSYLNEPKMLEQEIATHLLQYCMEP